MKAELVIGLGVGVKCSLSRQVISDTGCPGRREIRERLAGSAISKRMALVYQELV